MKRPTIRILEETTNSRGDLFNRLIEDLFLALGYENVRFNIHKPGREIDIEATHRTERRQVRAECKATKEPVGGSTINKFVGALDAERRLDRNRNREIIGYFISLSGFTETALEQENETGQRIILLNADQIIQELIKGHILAPIEKVMEQAGRCAAATSGIEVETPPELLAHETGWIWAVYYCSNKQRTHFTLIHADGEVLSRDHSELILQSELSTDGKFKSLQFLAPSPESRPIQQLIAEARTRYFQYLLDECGEIQLEGLPADQEVGIKRLNLENIFVPLYLESQTSISQREPVGNILATQHRLAILGPPGSGKSTLLKRLALAYAFPERRKLVDDHLPEHPWFPLFVRCRQFGNLATQPIREILFSTLRRIELPEDLANALRSFVDGILQNGQALLLIDGLDEISDPSFRASFISQLRTFLATYPVISIILTSREAGFRLISGPLNSICTKYRLADFEEEDIRRLSVAWHREVLGDRPAVNAEAERLVKNICESDRVRALAKNPLLLTTLLLVKRWVGELPHRRSVLYGKAIEVLLMTWNVEAHRPLEQDEAVPQLAFVAFSMMKKGVQQISLKRLKEILLLARQQMPELLAYTKDSVSMFISLVEFRSSILILSGNIIEDGTIYPLYEYRHLTFQEYLAAKAIVDGYYQDRQDGDTLLSVLMPYPSTAPGK